MLDRSSKLDDSLMDAYRSIHEIHKGHAAGESDIEKQASQLASDIRYKAKGRLRDGMNAEDKKRIYLKLLAASPAPGIVKNKAKRKLLGESVLINEIMPVGDTAAERTANVKRVVRGGVKVGKRVARGVAGIAKREGTLSQKVTGAAIDAVKGRVGDVRSKVGSKVRTAAKKVDSWSKSDTTPSGKYSNVGSGRKEKVSSSQSKSETSSSYKAKSEKKKQTLGQQARNNPEVKKEMIRARGGKTEAFSNWKLDLLGEEGYDKWRDKHLEHGGIGAVASKSPSRPYTRSEKQPKGDTNYQKEMRKKHGGKLPSAVDVVRARIEKESGKGAIMKNEETSAADKIINNIRSQRVDEGKLVHGPFGPYISGQKMPKEQREVPLRKVPYEDINSAKKVVGEAKVDDKLSPEEKEKARNKRKYGNWPVGQHAQTSIRRSLGWANRGEKKRRGAKVEEEVGVSSSAAILKARQEAELKAKEEAAVKKAKKAKNEEVALENRMAAYTAGAGEGSPASRPTVSKKTADRVSRSSDERAFGDRKKKEGIRLSPTKKYSGKDAGKTVKRANTTGRGTPTQYRKSHEDPDMGRYQQKVTQGKGSIKDLKNEYSPAVEKVIESIKINKASPKSPNCIIMPKKDDIADKAGGNGKKSTKNVVSKKQKQFFNQEGKTYSSFITEVVKAITKAAASQAAKGAITTTAKTVGKETVKQTGGAIVKSGGSAVAKQTGGAIVKKGGGSIVKSGGGSIVKSGGGKLTTKGGALAKVKKGGKEIVKQGSSQLAVNKAGELANRDKGGALTKQEPQKQGNQSKGFNMPKIKKVDTTAHTITTKNQQ